MKIIDKAAQKFLPFSFLENGSIFKDEEGTIFLKLTANPIYESNDDEGCDCYNAYCLSSNVLTYFDYDENVEKVEATLILNVSKES